MPWEEWEPEDRRLETPPTMQTTNRWEALRSAQNTHETFCHFVGQNVTLSG